MYLCYFFFLLSFFASTVTIQSQGMGPGELITAVNDPFAQTVRPVLEYESGNLVLKLVNGFHHSVLLTQIELRQTGSKSSKLLQTPLELSPAETKYIDLDPRGIDLSQKIGLGLQVSPKPAKQKSEFLFRFERGTGRIVEVESEARPEH